MAKTRFQIIDEARTPETAPTSTSDAPAPAASNGAATLLLLLLKILSQRSVEIAGHALPLIALGLGFILWRSVMPEPSIEQLGGLGLYGAFALLMLVVRR